MKAIYPIRYEQCRPYYGKPVFVFLQDGTELVGTLSRLDGNKLILNEEAAVQTGKIKTSRSASRSKKGNAGRKAAFTEPAGPKSGFSPPGDPIVLDSAFVAQLIALD